MPVTDYTKQNNKSPYLIGVAGGSGSGKTYFAKALMNNLGLNFCSIVYQDSFYIDQSHRFDFDGGSVNFDHPSSIDFSFLGRCLAQLKQGQATEIPIYDFVTHKRKPETVSLQPKPIIIVDGILIFNAPEVRCHLDDLVFFDTPEELRYQRRLERDVKERGRTPDGVRAQFLQQVKPMHDQFVEPSKTHAHTIVSELNDYDRVLKDYSARCAKKCAGIKF